MLKNSSFFVFQGNSVFSMIEQAELNRAFFQDLASRAEPSFGSDITLVFTYSRMAILLKDEVQHK